MTEPTSPNIGLITADRAEANNVAATQLLEEALTAAGVQVYTVEDPTRDPNHVSFRDALPGLTGILVVNAETGGSKVPLSDHARAALDLVSRTELPISLQLGVRADELGATPHRPIRTDTIGKGTHQILQKFRKEAA